VAERDRRRFAGLGERPSLEQHRQFGYRPQLDGVRALAIIPVVTYHAWVVPRGGFLGVDIFFVLSGFLITTLLVEEAQANGRISLPHFYFRRALRLLPALFAAALGYVLLSSLEVAVSGHTHAGTPLGDVFRGAAYGVVYVQNILIATGTAMPLAVGHLWSLATEEQFYLLWPFALVIVLRLGLSRRTLTILLVAVIAVLNIDRLDLILGSASFQRVYFAPDGHFDVILIGCLAGLVFTGGRVERLFARPARALALAGLAAVGLMLALPEFAHWHVVLGLLPLLAVGISLLILAVVVDDGSPVARVLSLPPLVFVGKISYALYLWHPIVLWAFDRLPTVVEVGLSVVLATLSYYLVELPFLRRKRRDRARIDAETASAAAAEPAHAPAS
jgi:peptidoglycan/LPS O-acetylase OafA/YrhL